MIQFLIKNNLLLTSLGGIASMISIIVSIIQLGKYSDTIPRDVSSFIIETKRNRHQIIIALSILALIGFFAVSIVNIIKYNKKVNQDNLILMAEIYRKGGNIEDLSILVDKNSNNPSLYQQLINARIENKDKYFQKAIKLLLKCDFENAKKICKLFPTDEDYIELNKKIIYSSQKTKGIWQDGDSLWIWDEKIENSRLIAYFPRLSYWLVNPSHNRIAVYEAMHARVYVISFDGNNKSLIADYTFITDNQRIAGWINDSILKLTNNRKILLNEYNVPIKEWE